MARPAGYQWEPLGWDTDPVPGDPQVISAEAARMVFGMGGLEGNSLRPYLVNSTCASGYTASTSGRTDFTLWAKCEVRITSDPVCCASIDHRISIGLSSL